MDESPIEDGIAAQARVILDQYSTVAGMRTNILIDMIAEELAIDRKQARGIYSRWERQRKRCGK